MEKELIDEIKQKIENHLSGSKAEILDPQLDGKHLKAIVTYEGFKEKTLIEQHRMVMDVFKDDLKNDIIHALSLETKVR